MRKRSTLTLAALTLFLLWNSNIAFAQPHHHHKPLDEALASSSIREITITPNNRRDINKPIDLKKGETVQLIIEGKKEGIYHLHGYNLMAILNEAQQLSITFQANHSGRYPLVLHSNDPLLGAQEQTIAYIEVKSH